MKLRISLTLLAITASFCASAQRVTDVAFSGCLGSCIVQFSASGTDMNSATQGNVWIAADPTVNLQNIPMNVTFESGTNSYGKLVSPAVMPMDFAVPQLIYSQNFSKSTQTGLAEWRKTTLMVSKLVPASLPLTVANSGLPQAGYALAAEPIGSGTPYAVQLHTNNSALYLAYTSQAYQVSFELEHGGSTGTSNGKLYVEGSTDAKSWTQIESVSLLNDNSRVPYEVLVPNPNYRYLRLRVDRLENARSIRRTNVRNIRVEAPFSDATGKPYSFESGIPSEWGVYGGGAIAPSSLHYKHYNTSLKWDWNNGSSLRVSNPKGISTADGMSWWIYNETPRNESVRFNLYRNGSVVKSFDYNLNFKGWRAFWYLFKGDGGLNANPDMVEVKAQTASGTLFFDCVQFNSSMTWRRMKDLQITALNQHSSTRDFLAIYNTPRSEATQMPSADEAKGLEQIAQRWENWLLPLDQNYYSKPDYVTKITAIRNYISSCKNQYPKYNIVRQPDGSISGKGLFNPDNEFTPITHDLYQDMIQGLALDYRLLGNAESLQKAFDVFDYLNDQGMAEGSCMGSVAGELLRFGGYCQSLFLLRKELKQASLTAYQQQMGMLYWHATCGKLFQTNRPLGENADDLRSTVIGMLAYIMMEPDPAKQLQAMHAFKQYVENGFTLTSSLFGTLKVDGSGFHHNFVYNTQYATEAMYVGAFFYYLFRETPFALSRETYDNLKFALTKLYRQAYFNDMPGSTGGRFPDGINVLVALAPAYAHLALSNPDDQEMVGMAKRICRMDNEDIRRAHVNGYTTRITHQNSPGALAAMLDLHTLPEPTAAEPQISEFLPYSGLLIHRYNGWLTTIKGFSKYVVDYECISMDGAMSRFMSYGHQQLSNESRWLKSYTPTQSWDWSCYPGATTKALSIADLTFKSGVKERNVSDEYFLGGLALRTGICMMAHNLHDNANDKSFRARKSTFIFENVQVNLGSDISNSDAANATQTTLFQNIQNATLPKVDGTAVSSALTRSLNEKVITLTNNWGNDYLLFPYGGGTLEVVCREQQGVTHSAQPAPKTLYDAAWINHGKAPAQKGYRYITLLDRIAEESQRLAGSTSPIRFVQQNSQAHIVDHSDRKITAYAVFEPNTSFGEGILHSTVRPLVAMFEQQEDARWHVALSDPDLALPEGEYSSASSVTISVKLRGQYSVEDNASEVSSVSYADELTTVTLSTQCGKTHHLTLKDEQAASIAAHAPVALKLYPNPASDWLTVECADEVKQIRLLDVSGQLLQQLLLSGRTVRLGLASIDDGVYYLEIQTAHRTEVHKWIKRSI